MFFFLSSVVFFFGHSYQHGHILVTDNWHRERRHEIRKAVWLPHDAQLATSCTCRIDVLL